MPVSPVISPSASRDLRRSKSANSSDIPFSRASPPRFRRIGRISCVFCPVPLVHNFPKLGIMSTSLAPDSLKASKFDPFTQRMMDSTREFYEMSISFE